MKINPATQVIPKTRTVRKASKKCPHHKDLLEQVNLCEEEKSRLVKFFNKLFERFTQAYLSLFLGENPED